MVMYLPNKYRPPYVLGALKYPDILMFSLDPLFDDKKSKYQNVNREPEKEVVRSKNSHS